MSGFPGARPSVSRSCWPESSRTLATNKTSDTPILGSGHPARSFRLGSLEPPMVRKGNHETLCTFPYGPHRDRNGVRDHCGNAAINNYICKSGESVHDSAYPAAAYAAVTTGARSAKTSVAGTAARERGGPFHPHANYATSAAPSTAAPQPPRPPLPTPILVSQATTPPTPPRPTPPRPPQPIPPLA